MYFLLYHLNVSVSFKGVPFNLHSPENFLLSAASYFGEKMGHFYGIRGLAGGVEEVVAEKNMVPYFFPPGSSVLGDQDQMLNSA